MAYIWISNYIKKALDNFQTIFIPPPPKKNLSRSLKKLALETNKNGSAYEVSGDCHHLK